MDRKLAIIPEVVESWEWFHAPDWDFAGQTFHRSEDCSSIVRFAREELHNRGEVLVSPPPLLQVDPDLEELCAKNDIPGLIAALDVGWAAEKAALMLGTLGDRRAAGPLIAVLARPDRNEDIDKARLTAAGALGPIGDCTAVRPLVQAAYGRDFLLVSRAVNSLGYLADRQSTDCLLVVLNGGGNAVDKSGFVQAYAADALGRLGDQRAVVPLMEALEKAHPCNTHANEKPQLRA